MNEKVKKAWLEALRSGEFKQAKQKLRINDKYCCLGVLCELHRRECGGEWVNGIFGPVYLLESQILPNTVADWAGLATTTPVVGEQTLSGLNDDGQSFREIANLIEENL